MASLKSTDISSPPGPFDKDYVDERINNKLNEVLNKILEKTDANSKELQRDMKELGQKMDSDIKELKKESKETKKDLDYIKNYLQVGINTLSASGVVLGILGVANIASLVDFIKSLLKLT